MRWLLGCLTIFVIACFSCACLGGIALAARSASPGTALASFESNQVGKPQINEQNKTSFDQKYDDFATRIAEVKPGAPAANATFSRDEVSSKLTLGTKQLGPEAAGLPLDSVLVDFRDNRAFVSVKLAIEGRNLEVRGRFKLTPAGGVIKVEAEQVELYGVTPFPIPITEFVQTMFNFEGGVGGIPVPFHVDTLDLRDGKITIGARPTP